MCWPNGTLWSAPPNRDDDSRTRIWGTSPSPLGPSPPPVSSHAAASPLMPPPTTTTRRTLTSAPTRLGGADHVGQHADEPWVVVERRRAGKEKSDLGGHRGQLHIGDVEDFEGVGQGTDRGD